jgi:hypothetical protein
VFHERQQKITDSFFSSGSSDSAADYYLPDRPRCHLAMGRDRDRDGHFFGGDKEGGRQVKFICGFLEEFFNILAELWYLLLGAVGGIILAVSDPDFAGTINQNSKQLLMTLMVFWMLSVAAKYGVIWLEERREKRNTPAQVEQ